MSQTAARPTRERNGRTLGWLSGLGVGLVPWVAAGVLATAASVVGSESWSPERTFPWFLLATFLAMLGWVGYGSLRIAGFRSAAIPGTAVAVAVITVGYVLVLLLQP